MALFTPTIETSRVFSRAKENMQISTLNSAGRPRHTLSHATRLRPTKRQALPTSPLSRAELRRIVAEMIG